MTFDYTEMETPVGKLALYVLRGALVGLAFHERRAMLVSDLERQYGPLEIQERKNPGGIVTLLTRYFKGDTSALEAIPVELSGTPFQRRVWEELRRIPAGSTWSYRDLARAVGRPRAVRAVGTANGRNPLAIVVPCHRVVGSDGRLHGYGGGLDRKEWLIRHEQG